MLPFATDLIATYFQCAFAFTTEKTLQQSFPLSERVFLQSVLMDDFIALCHKLNPQMKIAEKRNRTLTTFAAN